MAKQPDALARYAGHAVAGVLLTFVVARMIKHTPSAVVVGVLGMMMHAAADAPVSQALSDLGL